MPQLVDQLHQQSVLVLSPFVTYYVRVHLCACHFKACLHGKRCKHAVAAMCKTCCAAICRSSIHALVPLRHGKVLEMRAWRQHQFCCHRFLSSSTPRGHTAVASPCVATSVRTAAHFCSECASQSRSSGCQACSAHSDAPRCLFDPIFHDSKNGLAARPSPPLATHLPIVEQPVLL